MSKTGKPFEALVFLQGVTGREADALRVDIAWACRTGKRQRRRSAGWWGH